MNDQKNALKGDAEEEKSGEQIDRRGQRSYASYSQVKNISFDPMKDLNLPGSYEEVLARFKRLQNVKALEALN